MNKPNMQEMRDLCNSLITEFKKSFPARQYAIIEYNCGPMVVELIPWWFLGLVRMVRIKKIFAFSSELEFDDAGHFYLTLRCFFGGRDFRALIAKKTANFSARHGYTGSAVTRC